MSYDFFLGIDPGVNGGLAILSANGLLLVTKRLPITDKDLLLSLIRYGPESGVACYAMIEQQIARPTYLGKDSSKRNRGKSSILKSTCILYAQYRVIQMALTALSIPQEEVSPKTWQSFFKLYRQGADNSSKWKNRLKWKAQQRFPSNKIKLYNCDAALLAEYARKKSIGNQEVK